MEQGFAPASPGTIIKRQLEDLVQKELGFSAFTEDDNMKRLIRPLLEVWGEVAYQKIQDEFLSNLPLRCVNARIQTRAQAFDWIRVGGEVYMVVRPGVGPETPFEVKCMEELQEPPRMFEYILNDGDLETLKHRSLALIRL